MLYWFGKYTRFLNRAASRHDETEARGFDPDAAKDVTFHDYAEKPAGAT